MLIEIPEADWKVFRQLHVVALERFCDRVLNEAVHIAGDNKKGSHERYSALFALIEKRDRELAAAFDGMRRSTALQQLLLITSHGLLTNEELGRFSEATRKRLQGLREIFK